LKGGESNNEDEGLFGRGRGGRGGRNRGRGRVVAIGPGEATVRGSSILFYFILFLIYILIL